MYKHLSKWVLICTLLIYMCIGFSSCLSIKQLRLFTDIPDTTKLSSIQLPPFVPSITHVGDILFVSILTTDMAATSNVNAANSFATSTPAGGGSGASTEGLLVDSKGNITMPELGEINVIGLTMDQVKEVVKKRASEFYKNPIVLVKSKNLKLTILGEVQRPGTYNVQNEKVTIIDLLAYSGDFSVYGKRDNILLMRHNDDNTISTIRFSVQDTKILKSPYYYLRDNDVVYIQPNPGKAYSSDVIFNRNIAYFGLAVSLFSTLLFLLKR
jgi:polysaccharide export outer membrane protein